MTNEDCFAYRNDHYCTVLTEVVCKSKQCKFYKTHKKYRDDLKKYPPCDYANIYAKRHKNDMKGCG